MANNKRHHDDELAKAPAAVEYEVTASQLRSLVDANISSSDVTPAYNRRIIASLSQCPERLGVFPSDSRSCLLLCLPLSWQ